MLRGRSQMMSMENGTFLNSLSRCFGKKLKVAQFQPPFQGSENCRRGGGPNFFSFLIFIMRPIFPIKILNHEG